MPAEIINLSERRLTNSGNGAREAMIEIVEGIPTLGDAPGWADFILATLWYRGFKIVPLDK